jgi:hypothetical protein
MQITNPYRTCYYKHYRFILSLYQKSTMARIARDGGALDAEKNM